MSAVRRFTFSGVAALLVALAAAAGPQATSAQVCYACGDYAGWVCAEKVTCSSFLIFSWGCSTETLRYAG